MKTQQPEQKKITMNRRQFVQGLAAGSIVVLGGCTQNKALGRSQLLLVTEGRIAQMADETWDTLKRQEKISRDKNMNRRLERVGRRIVRAAGLDKQSWEFILFDNDQANAFVLPGGKVGFYTGIFGRFDNDDQLAAVMGHEVGHVTARHSAERYSQQITAKAGTIATSVVLDMNDVQGADQISRIFGLGVQFGVLLPYSRNHELEADRLGLQYMHKAGYNAREAITVWENMAARRTRKQTPELLSTHPSDGTRIAAIQKELRKPVFKKTGSGKTGAKALDTQTGLTQGFG